MAALYPGLRTSIFDFYVFPLTFVMGLGPNASVLELVDSIHAAQMAGHDCHLGEAPISSSANEAVIMR